MSFWNDLTKEASEAASFAAKKAGDLSSVAKLKLMLHSEETKLNESFEKIGKLYYEIQRTGKDAEAELRAQMSAVDQSKRKIAELKKQIADYQSDTVCPGCGEKLSKDNLFCPFCGTKMKKDSTDGADESADSDADTTDGGAE